MLLSAEPLWTATISMILLGERMGASRRGHDCPASDMKRALFAPSAHVLLSMPGAQKRACVCESSRCVAAPAVAGAAGWFGGSLVVVAVIFATGVMDKFFQGKKKE